MAGDCGARGAALFYRLVPEGQRANVSEGGRPCPMAKAERHGEF